MKQNIFLLAWLILLTNCTGTKTGAEKVTYTVTDELKQIYEADRAQRLELSAKDTPVDFGKFNREDSVRLGRVIELDQLQKINTAEDKYYAAWIYHHGGGSYMTADSVYFKRAYELFGAVVTETADKELAKQAFDIQRIAYSRWQRSLAKTEKQSLDLTGMTEKQLRQQIRLKMLAQVDTTKVNMDSLNVMMKMAEDLLIKQLETIKGSQFGQENCILLCGFY